MPSRLVKALKSIEALRNEGSGSAPQSIACVIHKETGEEFAATSLSMKWLQRLAFASAVSISRTFGGSLTSSFVAARAASVCSRLHRSRSWTSLASNALRSAKYGVMSNFCRVRLARSDASEAISSPPSIYYCPAPGAHSWSDVPRLLVDRSSRVLLPSATDRGDCGLMSAVERTSVGCCRLERVPHKSTRDLMHCVIETEVADWSEFLHLS